MIRTVEHLRADIDSGKTGDKVAGFDPAAAPLGADDEAAGRPDSARAVARAGLIEHARPHEKGERPGLGHAWILVAFTVLLATGIVIWAAVIHASMRSAGPAAVNPEIAMNHDQS